MKKLFEIVKERYAKQVELFNLTKEFKTKETCLENEIKELKRLENIGENNLDLQKIQIAETLLIIRGNPYGNAESEFGKPPIANVAIIDIANGCPTLKSHYFGNKRYGGYYQRCDCSYGSCPTHGSIVDEIGLQSEARTKDLTDDEKDACIYYLKNYPLIAEAKKKLDT